MLAKLLPGGHTLTTSAACNEKEIENSYPFNQS
jgi:hypothetical protein